MKKKLTRRQFLLAMLSAGAAGITLNKTGKVLGADGPKVYLPFISGPQETPEPTPTPDPTPEPTLPPPTGSRVVRVHSNTVTTWTGSDNYWEYVNQDRVNAMVNAGLCGLTGKATVAEAWQTLLPNYLAGEGIAIKANFNNTMSGDSPALSNPIPHVFLPVLQGLVTRGVRQQDIWFYDVSRRIPSYFYTPIHNAYPNIKFFDLSHEEITYTLNAQVSISAPGGGVVVQNIPDQAARAKYLINAPIMRNHSSAGVTLGFKNHFGSIHHPWGFHELGEISSIPSVLRDLYKSPWFGPKTILTLGDGIFAALGQQDSEPSPWVIFGDDYPKSLFFAKDPVAIDSVMADFLDAEWGNLEGSTDYLVLAQAAGLGTFEHVANPLANPSSYTEIDYQLIEQS